MHEDLPISGELGRDLFAAISVREAEAAIDRWLRPQPAITTAAPLASETIGMWRRVSLASGTEFVRDATLDDPTFWSAAERIGPKTCTRAVLLGESVARGAFVDPLFNCAHVLRTYLEALDGSNRVEIVDLARNGLSAAGLLQLTADSVVLEPDVLMIFAGNNWILRPSAVNWDGIADELETGASWSDITSYFQAAVQDQVAELMLSLTQRVDTRKTPILFVIPANNVRDTYWRPELYDPISASSDQAAREQNLASAEVLLAAKKYKEARTAAEHIVDRDPKLSARALQICGLCALAIGDADEAAKYFGEMEDASLYSPVSSLWACGPTLSGAIRRSAEMLGITTVDLRQVFYEANNGLPPDREIFLDDVHMTPRGIQLAMAALTERLLPILGMAHRPYKNILGIPVVCDPSAAAQGHFIAALLQWANKQEDLIEYHATKAIGYASEMALLMRSMMRMLLSQHPESYHEAYAQIAAATEKFPSLRLVLYRIPLAAAQPLYLELARALARAANSIIPGTEQECECLLRQTVVREGYKTNLLRHVIRTENSLTVSSAERSYIRSFNRRTDFRLQCDSGRDLQLEITARRGNGHHQDACALLQVNGEAIYRWELEEKWKEASCTVPARVLQEGINELSILWPDPCLTRADRAKHLTAIFRGRPLDPAGFTAELFPVHGDIYSCDVRPITTGSLTMNTSV